MRTLLALARAATLAWLAVVGLGAASLGADEESESPWLSGGSFERAGSVHSGSTAFHIWRRSDAEAAAAGDATLLTLLREEEGVVREAYDVARAADQVAELDELFTIRRRAYAEEEHGSRIAETRGGMGDGGLELARSIVDKLVQVEPRWLTGARLLEEALRAQQDPEDASARGRLRDATRALERAHQTAPWHLGIVCDLLAAYQLLLPYEVGTDRGANISFLWREACGLWLTGAPTEDERALGLLCQVSCVFAEGCYPLVAELLEDPLLKEREDVEPLRRALAGLGQGTHETQERLSLSGPRGHVHLQAITCPNPPRTNGLAWHRRVYLTYAAESQGPPLPVWFSLSLEGEQGARRWALVGWVGGSRRVLRLYGAKEPEGADVDALVTSLIQQTADAEEVR